MYQHSDVSANQVNVMTDGSEPALTISHSAQINTLSRSGAGNLAPEAGSDNEAALHQLRSVVAELVAALGKALHDERGSADECLRRAAAILETVEQPPPAAAIAPVRGGLAPWQICRVTAYIEANLDTPIRNSDLAAVARLSPFHFNRAFRNSVGDSPHEYIIRRRMERAQGLMLSTNASLSQIAADCGLADQAHFTRLFRRVAGDSPAAWRRARASPVL